MSELKAWTAQEIANSEKNFLMPPIKVYLKSEADKVIAEKDKTIAELEDKCQMHDFFWEGCGFKKLGGFKNSINVRDYCDELKRQNEDLIPKCRKRTRNSVTTSTGGAWRWRIIAMKVQCGSNKMASTNVPCLC